MNGLIDTHCHLTSKRLGCDLAKHLQEAEAAGVTKIISVGCDFDTSLQACIQASEHKALFASVGIQPHDASQYTPDEAEKVVALARKHKKVVAIGEIGLEGFHKETPLPIQIECFRHFLTLAIREQLPAIIHVRDTFPEVIHSLEGAVRQGLRGVIHCFTGTLEEARKLLDLGLYISFAGIVTFKNSSQLQEVAKLVPSDRFLIETDSPYLSPVPRRGEMNRPLFLPHTAAFIAALRNVSLDEFSSQTSLNAHDLFRGLHGG